MTLKVLAALAMLSAIPTIAAERSIDIYTMQFDAKSREARIERARLLLAEVDKLFNLLQAPRPADVAWMEQELLAVDKLREKDLDAALARRIQLGDSPESQQITLHRQLVAIRDALKCTMDPKASVRKEMLCWAVASYGLDNRPVFEWAIESLMRAGRLPDDALVRIETGTKDGLAFKYNMLSRNIEENILIPYLRGDISDSLGF